MKRAYFAGMLLPLALALSMSAAGSSYRKTIEVYEDGVTVEVDGEKLTGGNFLYKDTVYVPLRAVSEALGAELKWDEGEKKAVVTSRRIGYDFPFSLYSYDRKTYLGKLVTDASDAESIWNPAGRYGSRTSQTSIWNSLGDWGSAYRNTSAFSKTAKKPPVIVDSKGRTYGYLTINEKLDNGCTTAELEAFLKSSGQ